MHARFLLLLTPILLAACTSTRGLPLTEAMLGEWRLIELEADRGLSALPDTHPVTVRLSQGVSQNLSGRAFVNRYNGTVRVDEKGAVTEVPLVAATRMAGPEPLMELEDEYFRRWEEAARLQVQNGQLLVYDGQGRLILRFERQTGE